MQTSKLPITGLIILGVLALFLVQNSSPTLTVTFFGITSIALPLGIWLLIPFLAGIVSSWFVALLLPKSRPANTSRTMESVRDPQRSPRQVRDNDVDGNDLEESGFEPEAERSPGKTLASDEKRWASSAAAQRRTSRRNDVPPSRLEEAESEVWDDEDWSDETEVNPSGVAVGDYEVHKEPVSAYRQGTLYSYSYSKSALEEVAEPEISEPNISEGEISELQSMPSHGQDSPLNSDPVEGLDPSDEGRNEEEDVIATSELTTTSEDDYEPNETLEAEFLDDSDDLESAQKSSGFLRSKFFNFKDKAPKEDDWTDPPIPPKDW